MAMTTIDKSKKASGSLAVHQERSRRTRDKILKALEALLRVKDFADINVAELAAKAGVSPASLYRRFHKKDGLLIALFELTLQRNREWYGQPEIKDRLRRIKNDDLSLREFLFENARFSLQMLRDLHHLARPMFIYARLRPDLIQENTGELIAMGTKAAKASLLPYKSHIRKRDLDQAASMVVYYFQSIYSDYVLFQEKNLFPDIDMTDDIFLHEITEFVYGYLISDNETLARSG